MVSVLPAVLLSFFSLRSSSLPARISAPSGSSAHISAVAGTGGSISPSGNVVVNEGANQSFSITPNAGYVISRVTVDGVNQSALSSYTFSNVTANHTITVTFTYVGGGGGGTPPYGPPSYNPYLPYTPPTSSSSSSTSSYSYTPPVDTTVTVTRTVAGSNVTVTFTVTYTPTGGVVLTAGVGTLRKAAESGGELVILRIPRISLRNVRRMLHFF